MKRENIKLIIGIIIGVLVTSVTVYAGISAFAGNIRFTPNDSEWNVSNVSEALEDLYDLAGENTYGVRRRVDSSSSEWERIGKSKNLVANAQVGESSVRNDFDNIYPWSDIKTYNYNTDTKEITAWFGDENFSFKPDGNIEVLTYIPEFYYLRYQKNGYEYVLISKNERKDFAKSEAFSVGRYTMSIDKSNSSRVHSRSGEKPLANKTITQFRGFATSLGEGFQQLDYHYFIIQLLYLVEYADYNSQAKLGPGHTNSSHSDTIASGGCDGIGMHSGSKDGTDNSSIIYRGMEDIYGNVWQFIDGINIKDYVAYINYDATTYAVGTFSGNYKRLGYINSSSGISFISRLGYDPAYPLVSFPTESLGSATTYISDASWQASGNISPHVGGDWMNGDNAGLWTWHLCEPSSFTNNGFSARLIKTN